MMPDEFSDEDLAIVQSMMKSNVRDLHNPHAAVAPQIVTPMRAEQAMSYLPSSRLSAAEQQAVIDDTEGFQRDDLQGMAATSMYDEGKGPRPVVTPQLAQAMAAALKPNLGQFQRPLTLPAKITRQANEIMRNNELEAVRDAAMKRSLDEEPEETVNDDGTISKGIRRR